MCGICLLIRQRISSDGSRRPLASPALIGHATVAATLTSADDAKFSRKGDAYTLDSSHSETVDLAPCTCAEEGLELQGFLRNPDTAAPLCAAMLANLRRRGPDTYGCTRRSFLTQTVPALTASPGVSLRTEVAGVAAVLGLRGHFTVAQPYDMKIMTDAEEDPQANLWDFRSSLMWNGEIFGGALCPPPWGSDTVLLATRLSQMELACVRLAAPPLTVDDEQQQARHGVDGIEGGTENLLPLLERQRVFLRQCTVLLEQQVEGPYSFIFMATRLRLAVFGRDPLGRHSLLSHVRVTRASPAAELDVELIVSSVGVQHRCHRDADTNTDASGMPASGEEKTHHCCRASPPPPPAGEAVPSCVAGGRDELMPCDPTRPKRPRHEQRNAPAPRVTAVSAEEDDEEMSGAAAGDSTVHSPKEAVCWQEVSVTGLFAVPLDALLVYPPSTNINAGEGTVHAADTLFHPACSSPGGMETDSTGSATAAAAEDLHVRLLHCPWQRPNHRAHPLLRTATLPMHPLEAPPFERVLAHEEIAVLPAPLLRWASHLMKSMRPEEGLERSWVDWAAAHYMLALAVSMHRRITVANSGAADGRDAQELSTARRRPLCILFSGGIDCTVLAALAHYLLPVETPIELVNVAFGENAEQAPDRVSAFRSTEELLRLPMLSTSRATGTDDADHAALLEREWRLVLVDVPSKMSADTAHIKDLLVPRHTVMDLDIGTALWYAARASGRMQRLYRSDVANAATADDGDAFDGTPPMTGMGSPTSPTCVALHAFSKHFRAHGAEQGSDLAPLPATRSYTEVAGAVEAKEGETADIEKYQLLIDVLVKEARSSGGSHTPVLLSTLGKEYGPFLQPQLRRYGYKKLGFYLNDAAKAGYVRFVREAPSKAVRLCRPVDMARAAVAPSSPWFTTTHMATQPPSHDADGHVQPALPQSGSYDEAYTSHAKVVLLGMGADETLGGYTRYRRCFQREGMVGAQRELQCDFARLWERNLGRDDRITMDSGREPRLPFLDEGVLRTLEWIVLKRRNHILTAQAPAEASALVNPDVGSSSAVAAPSSPVLTSDELLRLALDPVVSFKLGPGEGDKRVLRRVAEVLGLNDVTHLQKRAIQFGSRIAEHKIKGTVHF